MEEYQEPCMTCGQLITRLRAGETNYLEPGSFVQGRRHRMRPDFEMDTKMGYNVRSAKASQSIDCLSNCLGSMRFNIDRLMNLLVQAWWAIRRNDPATPSYVRVATELKHTLLNLINAVDSVVAWMTGGCIAIPIFDLKPCETFDQWAQETFSSCKFHPRVFATLPATLDQIRAHINHINDQIPHIWLEMQHVREEHGNNVGFLMSPQQITRCGGWIGAWDGHIHNSRSLDQLRSVLGIIGTHAPVPWALAHMVHFLKETIELVQRENPNSGCSDNDE